MIFVEVIPKSPIPDVFQGVGLCGSLPENLGKIESELDRYEERKRYDIP